MGCPPTTQPLLTRALIESLGFQIVTVTSNIEVFRYQQYTLKWNTQTNKVEVIYGTNSTAFDYVFVSIVLNIAELRKYLQRNNVIS
jgi:hypothetical protein